MPVLSLVASAPLFPFSTIVEKGNKGAHLYSFHNTLTFYMFPISLQILYALFGLPAGFDDARQDTIRYFEYLRTKNKSFAKYSNKELYTKVWKLKHSRLIRMQTRGNGTTTITLTEKGKARVLQFQLKTLEIQKHLWDGKWRTVLFDIPEKQRVLRDSLRNKLQAIGFVEIQKSVFIIPYECKDQIDFLVESMRVAPYTRYALLEFLEDDTKLRKYFKLK